MSQARGGSSAAKTAAHVVVVGGGLAGLAAAAALVTAGCRVTVLESRRKVGGRAASYEDPVSGGLVDACQHVAMGCCTNFLDLCQRTGLTDALRRDRTLWFIGPDGDRSRCTPSRWLPAPLHLAPLLFGMRHFSVREKLALARGMLRIARLRSEDRPDTATALE
ncbi:MAG: FAD-dependent oxidoreductase, partial [Planctomycetota bacterium]